MLYETVIGLEVHVELSTKSKLFCSCSTEFGSEPNTQCCPVCMGMPGTLPVLNIRAVDFAIMAGLATDCQIRKNIRFDRKNYFYPDLPKSYQISQLYFPICYDGHIDLEDRTIGIKEIHIEEDAGKLIHDADEDCSLVDYNRAGVPLLEIVSYPDMRSGQEAVDYLTSLRRVLRFIDVSDCKMQEGSFRVDINVSVRPKGESELGVRTEMKNLNSFRSIFQAIESESARQIALIEAGEVVDLETRRWDDATNRSYAMRAKENVESYRYFPDPDLPQINIDLNWIDSLQKSMPDLPDKKKKVYMTEYGISEKDSSILTSDKKLVEIFERASEVSKLPKEVAKWILGDLLRLLKENNQETDELYFSPEKLGQLVLLIDKGTISRSTGKEVFEVIYNEDIDPEQYIKDHNLAMINDEGYILSTVLKVLNANPKSVDDYKKGKDKAFSYLVGQMMKELKGKGDPKIINKLLIQEINNLQ